MATFDNPGTIPTMNHDQSELMKTTREIFINSITGSVSGGVKDALDYVAKSADPVAAIQALQKSLADYKVFPPAADVVVDNQLLISDIQYPDGVSTAKIEYANQRPSHMHFHKADGSDLDIRVDASGANLSMIGKNGTTGETTQNTAAGKMKIDQTTGWIELDVTAKDGTLHSASYHPDGGFDVDGKTVVPNILQTSRDKIEHSNTPDAPTTSTINSNISTQFKM
ncbi:hypothetical protein BH10CYA1_BH10CYA1_18510 [soil metagenome]